MQDWRCLHWKTALRFKLFTCPCVLMSAELWSMSKGHLENMLPVGSSAGLEESLRLIGFSPWLCPPTPKKKERKKTALLLNSSVDELKKKNLRTIKHKLCLYGVRSSCSISHPGDLKDATEVLLKRMEALTAVFCDRSHCLLHFQSVRLSHDPHNPRQHAKLYAHMAHTWQSRLTLQYTLCPCVWVIYVEGDISHKIMCVWVCVHARKTGMNKWIHMCAW